MTKTHFLVQYRTKLQKDHYFKFFDTEREAVRFTFQMREENWEAVWWEM